MLHWEQYLHVSLSCACQQAVGGFLQLSVHDCSDRTAFHGCLLLLLVDAACRSPPIQISAKLLEHLQNITGKLDCSLLFREFMICLGFIAIDYLYELQFSV